MLRINRRQLSIIRHLLPAPIRRLIKRKVGAVVAQDTEYEKETQDAFRMILKPGDTAFDVGANVGELSVVLSRMVGEKGRVFAFEANTDCVRILRRTLRINGISNCVIEQGAVCEIDGQQVRFYLDRRPTTHGVASSLLEDWYVSDGFDRKPHVVITHTLTLDGFCRRNHCQPRIVKVDVEGAELRVLKGFTVGLSANRPFLLLEARSDGTSQPDHFVRFLEARDYRLALLAPVRFVTAAEFCTSKRFERSILAAPQEKLSELAIAS